MASANHTRKPVRKWIKVALDALLLVLLALMYRKNAISLSFHEIGGLALIGLFLLHHLFNAPWIAAVTPRAFKKGTPGKTRLQFALSVLLLFAVLAVGISGALISKTVFAFRAGGFWKTLHYFSAALTVVLSGVHAGLHAAYLFGFLRRKGKAVRALAGVVLAAVLAFGCYSIASTSFSVWLVLPFAQGQSLHGGASEGFAAQSGRTDALPLPEGGEDAADAPAPAEEETSQHGGGGNGQGKGGGGEGGGLRRQDGSGKGAQGSASAAAVTALQFVSIAAVFAAFTAAVEWLLVRRSARKAASSGSRAQTDD